jgi:DNA-binding winged helix-turn-helix (wHTH) protein/tetratricopeptide (TPR) repeat protein
MAAGSYRFGVFRLDAQARELFEGDRRIVLPLSTIDCLVHLVRHRDRPVGRDELAAAVWGRADVSEVSLSHAIMRLRRVLGDDGNAQRIIRTVPRLGWRWVMPDTREVDAAPAVSAGVDEAAAAAAPASRTGRRRRLLAAGGALAALLCVALAWSWQRHGGVAVVQGAADAALVLPVAVDAPAEWEWLRLGLMDLVATRLRRAALPTTSSETVVAVLGRGQSAVDALPASWRIAPSATLGQGQWDVRLAARHGERRLEAHGRASDPVAAARAAADDLLIKLGHAPPAAEPGDRETAEAILRQRINAAVLSGQLDLARQLIAGAAPALAASPEIAMSAAKVAFFGGDYEAAREAMASLLARLPADAPGRRWARALNTLGAASYRLGRLDDAAAAYAQAVQRADAGRDPDVLASALIGRAGVASDRLQLDAAAADYGRARTLLAAAGDAFGVAAVDLNLGINALQRGQPAAALPLVRGAAGRFALYAAEDALGAALIAESDAELALLDHDAALATAQRLHALEQRSANPRQRGELAVARAAVLIGSGRLAEAEAALGRVLDQADPTTDAVVRAQASALLAEIAYARGDIAQAAELAATAHVPALASRLRPAYAEAWLLRIRALREAGDTAAAREELDRMQAWSGAAPQPHDRIRVALATAEQEGAEGHAGASLASYEAAMALAAGRGIPAELVEVGASYASALLAAGKLDQAVSVSGRLAPLADRDARAAATAARVHAARGDTAAAAASRRRAEALAGERPAASLLR